MMNKSTADPSGNYGDYLADTVEANKDSFDEDELKTLTDDIETIRKIEEQIAEMGNGNTASEDSDAKNDSEEASPFRDFSGQDYDGNTVDESLFSKNAVTVVNFWFTGCKPCVAELSKLFLKARVRNTAIFPLTLLPLQESMLPILWHFRPQS